MGNLKNNFLLLIVGEKDINEEKPYELKFIDNIKSGNSDQLKTLYSSADILLSPSILEAQGQVAVEALSCGVPVVAFEETGFTDIVVHKKNGYLSKYLNNDDFVRGIQWIMNNLYPSTQEIKNQLTSSIDIFSSDIISKKYIDLYKNVIKE